MTTSTRKCKATPPPSETEAGFQQAVIDLAVYAGWRVNHTYDSRKTGPHAGFPDLVMARDGRCIFAELKAPHGRLRIEQIGWINQLSQVKGVEAYIWRPIDWDSIVRLLTRRTEQAA